jgi:hypothetical protein
MAGIGLVAEHVAVQLAVVSDDVTSGMPLIGMFMAAKGLLGLRTAGDGYRSQNVNRSPLSKAISGLVMGVGIALLVDVDGNTIAGLPVPTQYLGMIKEGAGMLAGF